MYICMYVCMYVYIYIYITTYIGASLTCAEVEGLQMTPAPLENSQNCRGAWRDARLGVPEAYPYGWLSNYIYIYIYIHVYIYIYTYLHTLNYIIYHHCIMLSYTYTHMITYAYGWLSKVHALNFLPDPGSLGLRILARITLLRTMLAYYGFYRI